MADYPTADAAPAATRDAKASRSADTELDTDINMAFSSAKSFTNANLAPQRIAALNAYHGEPYGDEEEGRSQVVDRSVRDTVRTYMPSLMRIFFGGRTVVEYLPQKPGDEAGAAQATDYINQVVVQQDNPGYLIHHNAFKDGLVLRTGWFKWWWDDRRDVKTYHYTNLTEENVKLLGAGDNVSKMRVVREADSAPNAPRFEVWLTIEKDRKGKVAFACIPNEEIFYNGGSRSVEEALAFFHSRVTTVGDVVAMGYDLDEVREYAMATGASAADPSAGTGALEIQARQPDKAVPADTSAMYDPLLQPIRYTEGYTFKDLDEDGFLELVKVCAVGEPLHVLMAEPTDEVPFSFVCPDPEAHVLDGESVADGTRDIQRIMTAATRFMLDAFSQSVMPGWEAVEDMVDLEDLQNTEIGRVVRVKQPGMLRELVPTATGQQMFGVLDYFEKVRESRYKQSAMSQGLDGNQLQSTEKAAAASMLSAAQADQEMVARNYGETGLKRLYAGLLHLTIKHQDKVRTVLLRGQWVDIDPRSWNAEMGVQINVGLGASAIEERRAAVLTVLDKQESIFQVTGGFGNPLVGPEEYRNALEDLVILSGRKDVTRYFKQVPPGWQPPAPAAAPDTATIVAQSTERIEMAKLQQKAQSDTVQARMDYEAGLRSDQLKRLAIEADFRAKIYSAEILAKTTGEQSQIDAQTERLGQLIEASTTNQASAADMFARMHASATDAATQQAVAAQQPPDTGASA